VLFVGDEGSILFSVVIFFFLFFSPTGIEFYETFSQKDLYLFFATLRIYIFITNNNLVIGD